MESIWDNVTTTVNYYFYELADPIKLEYQMFKYPWPIPIILGWYYFSLYGGRKFMKNRKPYDLSKIMVYYNAFQCMCNLAAFLHSLRLSYNFPYSRTCIPVPRHDKYWSIELTKVGYFFFLLKILDLTDTIFMVLRKNYHQITFLHICHHGSMAIVAWVYGRYSRDGVSAPVCMANMLVHTIMYYYYYLTAKSPEYSKSITLKKRITKLQILQFVFGIIFVSFALVPSCKEVNKTVVVAIMAFIAFQLYLFIKFYYDAYVRPKNVTFNTPKNKRN